MRRGASGRRWRGRRRCTPADPHPHLGAACGVGADGADRADRADRAGVRGDVDEDEGLGAEEPADAEEQAGVEARGGAMPTRMFAYFRLGRATGLDSGFTPVGLGAFTTSQAACCSSIRFTATRRSLGVNGLPSTGLSIDFKNRCAPLVNAPPVMKIMRAARSGARSLRCS